MSEPIEKPKKMMKVVDVKPKFVPEGEEEAEVVAQVKPRIKMTPEEAKAKKAERNAEYYKKNIETFKARDRAKNKSTPLERCKILADTLTKEERVELIQYVKDTERRVVEKVLEGMTEEQRAMMTAILLTK
jgi:hypothetical protein